MRDQTQLTVKELISRSDLAGIRGYGYGYGYGYGQPKQISESARDEKQRRWRRLSYHANPNPNPPTVSSSSACAPPSDPEVVKMALPVIVRWEGVGVVLHRRVFVVAPMLICYNCTSVA